jgi:hypothetical protein
MRRHAAAVVISVVGGLVLAGLLWLIPKALPKSSDPKLTVTALQFSPKEKKSQLDFTHLSGISSR